MAGLFQRQGRALLAQGYLIVPIRPGEKRPAINGWERARLGAGDLGRHADCGVGVLTGQGANPLCAFDVDCLHPAVVDEFVKWCNSFIGFAPARVGNAPKILLVYRAAEDGWGKAFSTKFVDPARPEAGQRLEVLGTGQQFVAYHVHPDTGRPYEWVDLLGGLDSIRADALTEVNAEQVQAAIKAFDVIAAKHGLVPAERKTRANAPAQPKTRTPAEDDDFFGRVNEAALQSPGAWVPVLFPAAREYNGGYRVESVDLGRDLQEAIGISPKGIVDFGVADMGDEREGKRSPIDLVLEWAPRLADDPLDAPLTPFDAALWLCGCMEKDKTELGFGLRRKKEMQAERQGRRVELDALRAAAAKCEDSLDLLGGIADTARDLVLATPALKPEVAAIIRGRYKELTGILLPAAELNRVLRESAAPTVKASRPLTEFGNAERMLDRYGQGLMYVPEMGSWYKWTGVFWRRCNAVELAHLAKETVKALPRELEEGGHDAAEFFKFCAISQQAKMVNNMVALAASDPRVMVPATELDKHSHLLGVRNGVVDLRTGELLEPDPELRVTKACACDYNPDAAAPVWEQTVREVFSDDADMVEFFHRLMGYTAMGEPKHHIMVIPHGNGSNGKSTVFGAIREVLGDYARAADASTFVTDKMNAGQSGGAAREDLVRLKGARFVFVSEPDENSELREGSIKAMTGGDALSARMPYGRDSVEFVPSWVIVMPTNHKPIVKGTDNGIWRRLMLVPFTRNFEADSSLPKDVHRDAKLRAEAEGILAWLVRGAAAYQRLGLKTTGTVTAAREDYKKQMDVLAEWLETHCEFGDGLAEGSTELWNSWQEYANRRGLLRYVSTSISLGRKLDARFPAGKATAGKRVRLGLRLKGAGISDFDLV